jgi:putative ABC transport system substrate-binding protein
MISFHALSGRCASATELYVNEGPLLSTVSLLGRRRLLCGLAAGAAVWPRGAFAQSRVPRVGLVHGSALSLNAFLQGLREAGYLPGQTIVVEHRQTEGHSERYGPAVEAVLKTGVNVMVVASTHGLTAARALTRSVPIVAIDLETDPVASGFVASLARPGANVTGFFLDLPEMSGKLLQLLKEAVPGATRIAVLWDAVIAGAQLKATEKAAQVAGITIHSAPVRRASDLEAAVGSAARDGVRALIVLSAPLMRVNQARIDQLALRHRLPSVTFFALRADGTGFMSYGPDLDDMFRRSASYVDRILKGARVADLPVERPSRFDLAVNLRTATALGLTVPPSLLARADQVIE